MGSNKRKSILLLGATIMTVVMLVLTGCSSERVTEDVSQKEQVQQTQPADGETVDQTSLSNPELILESVEQEEDMMIVTTSYCQLRFPFAFSDVIRVCVADQMEQAVLQFNAYLEKTEYPLFSIVFGSTEGIPVGSLTLEDGTVLPVTAHIFSADDGMESSMLQTFYAAQESINDVIGSLMDAKGFSAAQ